MKRLFIAGFLILAGLLFGQSKDDLRRKYGEPVSEVFAIRPGINASASYGADGRIVEWLIAPRYTDMIKSRSITLSQKSVDEVLNELVPASVRGKALSAGFMSALCRENDCGGSSQEFENVSIYYNGGKDGGICYAVVRWRD